MTEPELVAHAAAGNQAACFELDSRYRPVMTAVCRRYVGAEKYEDLAQVAMAKMFLMLHTFRGESKFKTWLTSITIRECLQELRKWKIRPEETELAEDQFSVRSSESAVVAHRIVENLRIAYPVAAELL